MIRLVALDIDGTLLAPGVPVDAVPDAAMTEAVHALRDAGIVVVQQGLESRQRDKRRSDHHFTGEILPLDGGDETFDELFGLVRTFVHLPVGGENQFTGHRGIAVEIGW